MIFSQKAKGVLSVISSFLLQFVNKINTKYLIILRLSVLNMFGQILILTLQLI
jgi:hypothetical protein